MNIIQTELPGVLILEPRVFRDARGFFLETYHAERYSGHRLPNSFVQDNLSQSQRSVLRGLHYQLGRPQGKLVMAIEGEIFDVAADIRRNSPTYGKWAGVVLSSSNFRQLYIPQGFAHGFCVLSEHASVLYKCTDYYAPKEERGIRYDDPLLAIKWPSSDPVLSEKDSAYPILAQMSPEDFPEFRSRP